MRRRVQCMLRRGCELERVAKWVLLFTVVGGSERIKVTDHPAAE